MTDQTATKPSQIIAPKGLQNVVVDQTKLSEVNGTEGKLIYAGYNIEDLAEHASFEEVIYLLWHLHLPTKAHLDELTTQLRDHMALSPQMIALLKMFPHDATP